MMSIQKILEQTDEMVDVEFSLNTRLHVWNTGVGVTENRMTNEETTGQIASSVFVHGEIVSKVSARNLDQLRRWCAWQQFLDQTLQSILVFRGQFVSLGVEVFDEIGV